MLEAAQGVRLVAAGAGGPSRHFAKRGAQIERGVMRPSVSRLIAYVGATAVPLSARLRDRSQEAARGLGPDRGGRRASRPVPVRDPARLEFFESAYPPGSMSNEHGRLLRHEGYEVGIVTSGELTIDFGTGVAILAAGDSIAYPCYRPHLISNCSATVAAVATWLIVNP